MNINEVVTSSIWTFSSIYSLFRLKYHNGSNSLDPKQWNWNLMILIFSIIQTLNYIVNYTRWFSQILSDPTIFTIIQILVLICSRLLFHTLYLMASKHFRGSRKTINRVELRTLLGMIMFGSLADLLVEGSEGSEEIRGIIGIQLVVLLSGIWTAIKQSRQILFFKNKVGRKEKINSAQKWLLFHLIFVIASIVYVSLLLWIMFNGEGLKENPFYRWMQQGALFALFLLLSFSIDMGML